nr:MAG TPA: periplasmic solute binding protein [Caudoviricetes sp.]
MKKILFLLLSISYLLSALWAICFLCLLGI